MEAGAQSALLIIWVLFWMLALSLLIVHPMFRPTRVQIRRSLRLNLHRRRTAQARLRGRTLRMRGFLRIRLGKALLWLARCLKKETAPPLWIRLPLRLLGRCIYLYLLLHLLFRQPLNWQDFLAYLAGWEVLDASERWWKRRKNRLAEANRGNTSTIKPTGEQSAGP